MHYSERLNVQTYDFINGKMDSEVAGILEVIAVILNDLKLRVNLDFELRQIQ